MTYVVSISTFRELFVRKGSNPWVENIILRLSMVLAEVAEFTIATSNHLE